MNTSESPLHWSFPCGTWVSTRVRISVFFPLLVVVLWLQLRELGLLVSTTFAAILFFSVLAHEFGHVVAARMTGGSGNEILIWPLGGLAFVQPLPNFASRFFTAAAGPLVNLALCLITLGPVLNASATIRTAALHPFQFPPVTFGENVPWLQTALVLVFTANWILLLINLLPVHPLDGGRMLQAGLATRWNGETGNEIYLRIGLLVAFVMLFVGLIVESVWLVFIGAIVLVLNMQESLQARATESYDESFMGYDFSQGYTSLERSAEPSQERTRPPGFLQRWREKRRMARERQLREQVEQTEQQVDLLLQKVGTHGIQSLTDAERRTLEQASNRLRHKDKLDG